MRKFCLLFLFTGVVSFGLFAQPAPESKEEEKPGRIAVWWANFVSYFNGYYNATRLYDRTIQLFYEDNLKNGNEIGTVFPVFKKGSTGRADLQKVANKATSIYQNHPESVLADDALLLMGKCYYFMGDLSPAERKFREVIANYTDPEVVFEATLFLSRAFLEQNKNEEALSLIQDLIKRPDVPDQVKGEANLLLGERYYLSGQIEDAIPLFAEGIRLYDDSEADARASYLIAKSMFRLGRPTEARRYYLDAASASDIPAVDYWSGVRSIECFLSENKPDEAQEFLNDLLDDEDLGGYYSALTLEQARVYSAKNETESARQAYQDFINDGKSTQLLAAGWFELGNMVLNQDKNLELARYFYEKAGQAGQPDTVAEKAKKIEADLKGYLELVYELKDISKVLSLGIKIKRVSPDSSRSRPDSLRVQPDSLSSKDSLTVELAETETAEQTLPGQYPQQAGQVSDLPLPNSRPEADRQATFPGNPDFNQFPPQGGDETFNLPGEDPFSEPLPVSGAGTKQLSDKPDPFSEREYSKSFIIARYKPKYEQAADSLSYLGLLGNKEKLSEKLVEHFYFISGKMDSVISATNAFIRDYPASPKIPRLIYARAAAFARNQKTDLYQADLKLLSENYSRTPYGAEARKRLGLPDSAGLAQADAEMKLNRVVYWIENGNRDSLTLVLDELVKTDSTSALYPRILFARGYSAEKLDKNWQEASFWYEKIMKKYPATPLGKSLREQLTVSSAEAPQKDAKENKSQETGEVETARDQGQKQETASAVSGKKEIKFAITPNLPARFKRQPKIALSW
ncbi:MAG: tetratricopeptide repeat protein [Bacteroidetes bacterium]|nr:tetratricopeptide repeat protein [Bacteroidota bacterium]